MTMSLLLDCIVLALVLVFVLSGMRHGFVRSLCSFLALFVALFGAIYLAKMLTPAVADLAAPYFLPSIERKLEGVPSSQGNLDVSQVDTQTLLKTLHLPQSWDQMLQKINASQSSAANPNHMQTPTQWLAFNVLKIVTSAVIFIVSFLLILFLWGILSRSLDLVARLPVLNFCNRILGALFGLLKALVFLFLLRWLLFDFWGIVPQNVLAQSYSYKYILMVFDSLPLDRFFLL